MVPSTKRLLAAAFPAVALLGAALSAPTAQASSVASYEPTAADYYINYAPPAVGKDPKEPSVNQGNRRSLTPAEKIDRKFTSGNPAAGRVLAKREDEAIRTGRNPAEWLFKKTKQTRTAKLLTILVEFNEQANDDFSGFNRLRSVNSGPDDCVVEPAGTLMNGPLHNNIPDPATLPHKDNNSFWVKDFSPEHFNKMLYTDKGITERVRPDLKDPRDGKAGIDISGFTMKKMYEEMSKGAYSVTGSAVGWIKVPHSEAWYGAAACGGAPQDMSGHPDNPLGAQQLPIDVVESLVKAQPDFPWADYDVEDVSDADGDGDFNEPDGVIDHLVLVHAGKDKSSDGGAEGTYAIWAHSSAVAGGYQVPGTDKKISNYIVQPEDSGVGVFAHEYGHDLGLPDLYDTSGQASSAVDFWDLMSSGSHSGPVYQSMPSHMGLWDKWVLGWANPKTFDPGDRSRIVTVGQSSRTPKFTEDGIRVNLPSTPLKMIDVHSGSNAWWNGLDQDWANLTLTRDVEVPAGTDVRFWMWNNYVIEQDWDFGFVEVSTDGGQTWSQQKLFDEAGNEVTTPDDYPDPNKNLKTFGNKKYGLTGSSGGWRHDYANLTPFAGQTIKLRLTFNSDAAFQERGWFADDFELTNGGTAVWSDDVENGDNGWKPVGGTFTNTSGQGWTRNNGEREISRFYLAEWRNLDGFDKGLGYTYDTDYLRDGAWKVHKVKYNAPGLLVWYRDSTFVNNNLGSTLQLPPSIGSKGSLLVVDSHYDPLRRSGTAAEKDPTLQKNLQGRVQSSNAAFGFRKTYPFTECIEDANEPYSEYCTELPALKGVRTFTDAKTWYPGLELIDGGLYYRDFDASVVVPSKGDQTYSTRVVHQDGTPATELYGQVAAGSVLGTGNPGDEGKALGVQFKLLAPLPGNLGALVQVVPPKK
ncbi:M6 family metalloprotease domain-containing protein [Nonomuraea phyllanthi]|uniref:M6 family metalloprotease domain-containing protein n=1 Tax=Nonomuraea phyllanthi TaxID=2219224 RepID=A0A5C4V381_9ACTN|nr:M6 family metalloprotease domain-containing protein [Nonomuraea phyllanthi]QFY14703.1 M6 family metalloprotease domain-containing protein [Nonomuraea phyllanthi]